MAKTYYNSELTGAQIENVLESVNDLMDSANNGKIIGVGETGKLEAVEQSCGKTYTAGTGISISEDNVISCTFSDLDEVSY